MRISLESGHAQATARGYHSPMTHLRTRLAAAASAIPPAHAAAPVHAQVPRPRAWTRTVAGEALHAGADSWGYGPRLALRRDFGPAWGVELTAALPAFGTNSGGAALDLAATYPDLHGPTEVGGTLGGTAFLVGDQSELTGGGIGVVVGAHVTQWAAPSVGFTLGATVRTAIGVFPSVYAGLTLRF